MVPLKNGGSFWFKKKWFTPFGWWFSPLKKNNGGETRGKPTGHLDNGGWTSRGLDIYNLYTNHFSHHFFSPNTLPETNGSPLKIGRYPIGK